MSGPHKTAADYNRETQQLLNNMDILHRQYLEREARDNAWRSSTPTAPTTYTSYVPDNWRDRRAEKAQERKDSIKEARLLRKRNEELKEENASMHKEIQDLQDLRHEVKELKQGLESFEQSNDVYKEGYHSARKSCHKFALSVFKMGLSSRSTSNDYLESCCYILNNPKTYNDDVVQLAAKERQRIINVRDNSEPPKRKRRPIGQLPTE